uniref:(northern house mosquito) hypothetical protein n=1 Tax=Culex pipiens TaxID=7175 RepID=A0A8D8GX37_CULPI
MGLSGRNYQLTVAAMVTALVATFLVLGAEAGRQPVPYEYNPAPADYPALSVQPLKSENCDCGYVLVEKVVHVCRPQKSLVKVLKKKGSCTLHEKPVEVQSKYIEYQQGGEGGNVVPGSTCPHSSYGVDLVSHEDED